MPQKFYRSTLTRLHSILFWLLHRTGYSVISNWRLDNLELALHLKQVFARHQIDCVFDVGANRGQYYDFLRHEAGYQGHIFSFEPIYELACQLQKRSLTDPLWHVYPFALGASAGEASINIMAKDDFSSFLQPDHAQTSEFSTANKVKQTQIVLVKCLDDVIPEVRQVLDFKNLYLKIDTQGFDLEVIKGARHFLPDIAAIQCEVSIIPIYQGMPDYSTTIATLKALGFDLAGLFPVTRDENLRVIEFDCVTINTARSKTGSARATSLPAAS